MNNLFDLFNEEDKKIFEEEQKQMVEKNQEAKKAASSSNEKGNSKKSSKKENDKPTKEIKPAADPNKIILEDIKNFPKIVVKAYGTELIQIEGETEIQIVNLSELEARLINEFQYHEFSGGICWHLVPNSDDSIGYLVATGKFYAKG